MDDGKSLKEGPKQEVAYGISFLNVESPIKEIIRKMDEQKEVKSDQREEGYDDESEERVSESSLGDTTCFFEMDSEETDSTSGRISPSDVTGLKKESGKRVSK